MKCRACDGTLERVLNDPANPWRCQTEGCWFHSNHMPFAVAVAIARHDEEAPKPEQPSGLTLSQFFLLVGVAVGAGLYIGLMIIGLMQLFGV